LGHPLHSNNSNNFNFAGPLLTKFNDDLFNRNYYNRLDVEHEGFAFIWNSICRLSPAYFVNESNWSMIMIEDNTPTIVLIMYGAFYLLLIAAKERKVFGKFSEWIRTYRFGSAKSILQNIGSDEDADPTIKEEIEKLNSIMPTGVVHHKIVINNVNGISLIGDDAMILGIIPDTKSTRANIMKKLIGQEKLVAGDIFIMGKSLRDSSDEALKNISYCSHECALQKYLTGRQNLKIFASLNGYKDAFINQEITNKIESLCLKGFIDEPVKNYTEANRKLLGIAIATFGSPEIVILEEPFGDLDFSLKSAVCDLLQKMKVEGKTVIIISTNFEDCEKICSKLAIVEKGRIRYLDSRLVYGIESDTKLAMRGFRGHLQHSSFKHLFLDLIRTGTYRKVLDQSIF
jgi:ABC-2 type transport system ATP-binding protein